MNRTLLDQLHLPIVILSCAFTTLAMGQDEQLIYTPTAKGYFTNNQRVGVWEYRDIPSEVCLRVNYSKGVLVDVKKDTSDFFIAANSEWVKTKLDIPCRFHGPVSDLMAHYQGVLNQIVPDLFDKGETLNTRLIFEVNRSGQAENPILSGNHDLVIKEKLLEAFATAPNFWIVGITADGESTRNRMAITFEVCAGECKPSPNNQTNLNAHRVFGLKSTYYTDRVPMMKTRFASTLSVAQESKGIQFSPDDTRVLIEITKRDASSRKVQVGMIIDRKTGDITEIPFQDIKGSMWLDSQRILFKYQFPGIAIVPAVYDLSRREITHYSDSTTYFHAYSKYADKIALSTLDSGRINVWYGDVSKSRKELLIDGSKTMLAPFHFSPDASRLLLLEREHNFEKPVLLDLETKRRLTIPVFDSSFAGWSKDGRSLYFYKVKKGDYQFNGHIFQYDISSDIVTNILPKTKNLWASSYSTALGKFALVLDKDLYVWEPESGEPKMIHKNASSRIAWSHSGRYIAFIQRPDGDLFVYDLESGQAKRLARF